MYRILFAALLVLGLAKAAHAEEPIAFTAQSGESVEAFAGTIEVPEYRGDPAGRTISLAYVRFPSTSEDPGPPIVYLAGGPGGSGIGTARGRRFALFMAMREHGDVIAFDQRGTGDSTALPECVSPVTVSDTERLTDESLAGYWRRAIAACGDYWRGEGVDLRGYTTRESVADLTDLRVHLGAGKISLWGISYGSHLALAALDAIPGEIDRVVLASAEGLDQTVKLPARTDAYFARLQEAVNTQPAARAAYPDIAGMMRRVHARLEAEPMMLTVPTAEGGSYRFLLQRPTIQQFASQLIADPTSAPILLALYASLDAGDASLATMLISQFHQPGRPITLRPMPIAMDVASGISAERHALFESQVREGLLGGYLNFPMPQAAGIWPGFELDEDFRTGPEGDTPLLLLTGTLDGRTYPEGQREAVAGLTNVTQVTIRNAGHNLFMSDPAVHAAIRAFMRGEPIERREIAIDLPDFMEIVPPGR
ncbi:MAG: alpha/beta fold hydrolase [Parasphingopyxis sp.]